MYTYIKYVYIYIYIYDIVCRRLRELARLSMAFSDIRTGRADGRCASAVPFVWSPCPSSRRAIHATHVARVLQLPQV